MSDVIIPVVALSSIATTLRSVYFANAHAILCNPLTPFTKETAIASIIGSELVQGVNGYAPVSYLPAQGGYDATDKRHELGTVTPGFTASGGVLSANTVVVWSGRGATANTPVLSINAANDTVTISSSVSVTDGDPVMVTSSGGQPGGIGATTLYYAKGSGGGVFELYDQVGLSSKVNISSVGSGTITFRLAKGTPMAIRNVGQQTINDGATFPVAIDAFVVNTPANQVGWV